VLTLKAAGLLDLDAGEIVRPGILRISADRILGVGGPPAARPGTRVTMDPAGRGLMAGTPRRAMTAASGVALDRALADLGWAELLAHAPEVAIPMVVQLQAEDWTATCRCAWSRTGIRCRFAAEHGLHRHVRRTGPRWPAGQCAGADPRGRGAVVPAALGPEPGAPVTGRVAESAESTIYRGRQ
jgi:hypothetical protein